MKVISWFIEAMLENGKLVSYADIPDDVANVIDAWLAEMESEEE